MERLLRLIGTALPTLLLVTAFRSAVASPFHVPTGSMVPSIEIGDRILVSKLAYGLNVPWWRVEGGLTERAFTTTELLRWAEPRRGDVVLFRSPNDPTIDFVKRVVGLPGEEVAVVDGIVFVDGVAHSRVARGAHDFVDGSCRTWPAREVEEDLDGVRYSVLDSLLKENPDFGPVRVPDDHLFVLGDNRDHSHDSRAWGMVPRGNVRGRVAGVWMRAGCDATGSAMSWHPL